MTVKPPTAAGISRLLGNAGFNRSTSFRSRIKGLRNYTTGYEVHSYVSGEVEVEHVVSSRLDTHRIPLMLAKYAEVIRAAGWQVREPAPDEWAKLTITAREG